MTRLASGFWFPRKKSDPNDTTIKILAKKKVKNVEMKNS
jgi:hypothetical protein